MRPRIKGKEKKPETSKSKERGRCGYDKINKKCAAMGQQCGLCNTKFSRSKEFHNLEEVEDSDPEEEASE